MASAAVFLDFKMEEIRLAAENARLVRFFFSLQHPNAEISFETWRQQQLRCLNEREQRQTQVLRWELGPWNHADWQTWHEETRSRVLDFELEAQTAELMQQDVKHHEQSLQNHFLLEEMRCQLAENECLEASLMQVDVEVAAADRNAECHEESSS